MIAPPDTSTASGEVEAKNLLAPMPAEDIEEIFSGLKCSLWRGFLGGPPKTIHPGDSNCYAEVTEPTIVFKYPTGHEIGQRKDKTYHLLIGINEYESMHIKDMERILALWEPTKLMIRAYPDGLPDDNAEKFEIVR